jgi:hypothetical protein
LPATTFGLNFQRRIERMAFRLDILPGSAATTFGLLTRKRAYQNA